VPSEENESYFVIKSRKGTRCVLFIYLFKKSFFFLKKKEPKSCPVSIVVQIP
jgi:hypothetical protein